MADPRELGRFEYRSNAQRVVFAPGDGPNALNHEAAALGSRRILLIAAAAERELADSLTARLPVTAVFEEVRPHVPVETAKAARALADEVEADLLLCVGGGSTTGTAKAVALTSGIPILAVPTTYAGSEATSVWGMTEQHRKTTGVDPTVVPTVVVYDAELTMSLPAELKMVSGLNALAHCIDSLWAARTNPISTALAMEGATALQAGLLGVHNDAGDRAAHEQCVLGTYLAGAAFSGAGSGLHHKICHVLGGAFDLPHAETHAAVLPYVVAFNIGHAPDADNTTAALILILSACLRW